MSMDDLMDDEHDQDDAPQLHHRRRQDQLHHHHQQQQPQQQQQQHQQQQQQQQQRQQQQWNQPRRTHGDHNGEGMEEGGLSPLEIQRIRQLERSDVLRGLWSGALEVFVHHLLFVRRVYPKQSFCRTRFLGVQCSVCRHPGVVSYIKQAVNVTVPSILMLGGVDNGRHVVKDMWIEIYDRVKMVPYESHVLSFSDHCRTSASSWILLEDDDDNDNNDDNNNNYYGLDLFERELRDMICSVGTLQGVGRSSWPDTTSFKILLATKGGGASRGADNRSLDFGPGSTDGEISSATWFRASSPSYDRDQAKRRIVYSIPNCGCQFQYLIVNELNWKISDI